MVDRSPDAEKLLGGQPGPQRSPASRTAATSRWSLPASAAVRSIFRWQTVLLGYLLALAVASAAEQVRSPEELKALSLEELLDTKVISVSRTLEQWKTAPTAITVL